MLVSKAYWALFRVLVDFWPWMVVLMILDVQESPGVPEGDEATARHVSLSTQGAEGQSPAHGCREKGQVRGDQHCTIVTYNVTPH